MPGSVLVAESSLQHRRTFECALELGGYSVVSVGYGMDALEQVRRHDFDVIVADAALPGCTGLELLRAARSMARETLVVVTADADLKLALDCLRQGAFDLLPRPVETDLLLSTVKRAQGQRKLRASQELLEASNAIFSVQDAERLPELIVNVATRVMNADDVSIMLVDSRGMLTMAHSSRLPPEMYSQVQVRVGEGIAGRVAADRVPALIPDPMGGRFKHASSGRVQSSIVFPLASGPRLVGVLNINRAAGRPPFRYDDVGKASVLASQVLLAIDNVRLLRQTVCSERSAAMGHLAAAAAHELNTPVQFLGDNAAFLRDAFADLSGLVATYRQAFEEADKRGALGAAAAEAVREAEDVVDLDFLIESVPKAAEGVRNGAARAAAIVRAMRELAPEGSNGRAEVDVNRLLQLNLELASGELQGVDVETELGELPTLEGSAGELNQAFSNLLRNAVQAFGRAPDGRAARGRVSVRSAVEGGEVVVSIADTGAGIDPEHRGRVFEPFFTTKGPGSAGLGLAVARAAVVDRHGGSITFQSEVGSGTTFQVRLPLAPPRAALRPHESIRYVCRRPRTGAQVACSPDHGTPRGRGAARTRGPPAGGRRGLSEGRRRP